MARLERLDQHPAVLDGTISASAAFCGMREDELARLAARHPRAQVLVRMNAGRFVSTAGAAAESIAREERAGDYCRDVTLRPFVPPVGGSTQYDYLAAESTSDANPGL